MQFCSPAAAELMGAGPTEDAMASLVQPLLKQGAGTANLDLPGGTVLAQVEPVAGGGALVLLLPEELAETGSLKRELEAIINSSHDGIWVTDGSGTTIRVNAACQKFYAHPLELMAGLPVVDVVGEKQYQQCVVNQVIHQQQTMTTVAVNREGRRFLLTGVPIHNETGELWRIVINLRDLGELDKLRRQLEQTEERYRQSQAELCQLRLRGRNAGEAVYDSAVFQRVLDLAAMAARSDSNLLIQGETGTGKDVTARIVHERSARKNGPFVKVNCAALPDALVEAELFGYEGGSFTGARQEGKPGVFELASGGTLFLDEIGELPLHLQAKLLHVLEEQEVKRVGGTRVIPVNTRVVAATNRDLAAMIRERTFREDLYHRLNILGIRIPPLRERPEDILALSAHFLRLCNERYGHRKQLTVAASEALRQHDWPGNVRELRNLIERLVVMMAEDVLDETHIRQQLPSRNPERAMDCTGSAPAAAASDAEPLAVEDADETLSLRQSMEVMERKLIRSAVQRHRTLRAAAQALKVDPSTLVRKLQKYQITTH